jgi:hypothetical protein
MPEWGLTRNLIDGEGVSMFWSMKHCCDCAGLVAFVYAPERAAIGMVCLNCGIWYLSVKDGKPADLTWPSAEAPDRLPELGRVSFPPARWATREEIESAGWAEAMSPEPNPWDPTPLPPEEYMPPHPAPTEDTSMKEGVEHTQLVNEFGLPLKGEGSTGRRAELLDEYGRPLRNNP